MAARRTNLSSVDTAWLRMEHPTNLMMITGILTFAEPLSYGGLYRTVEQRLLQFDRFRQRIVEPRTALGSPAWERDPHFDLRSHIHHIALPAPGDQEALQELVSSLMSVPLDFSKPLWHFYLIDGYGGGSVLFGRLHHTLADGIALMRVLLSLTDDEPDAVWEPVVRKPRPGNPIASAVAAVKRTRKLTENLLHEGLEAVMNPERMSELAKMGASGAEAVGRLALRSPDPKTLFKGDLGVMKRAAWSQPIPLADVKAVGKVTGGTVNDVMLTAMTGALRRYLESRQTSVRDLNFRAAVPVNLRPLDGPIELGNKFGLVFLSLPVGIVDPVERITELKRRMDALKGSAEPVVSFGVLGLLGMVPNEIEQVALDLFGAKATCVMTNVPGPRQTIYLAGSRVNGLMFWVPQSGRLGLGVSIMSYAGQVWLGVATDAGLVPDPDNIIEGFHTEFDDLMSLVVAVAEEPGRCEGLTKAGTRCKKVARPGSPFCHIHRG